VTTPAEIEAALITILSAPDEARRALIARLGGDLDHQHEQEWPPQNIDFQEPYWQWMNFEDAAAAGPHGKTKLNQIRHQVSKIDGGKRWYSLRRIWQVHGAD